MNTVLARRTFRYREGQRIHVASVYGDLLLPSRSRTGGRGEKTDHSVLSRYGDGKAVFEAVASMAK